MNKIDKNTTTKPDLKSQLELTDSLKADTKWGMLVGESKIGGRKENQDSFGYFENDNRLLVVVCDGMGGANGGKIASTMATQIIINEFAKSESDNNAEILVSAIIKANETVYNRSVQDNNLKGMGTTVVAIIIDDDCATVAHVGDSRVYQIRGKNKVFRTFDHSMVFELVKRNAITEEQARLSAESNVILRALGTKASIDVELSKDLPFEKGDRFLLCSDGICGALPEKELLKILFSRKEINDVNQKLVKHVDSLGHESGGNHDNLTAAFIQTSKNSKQKVKMDKNSKIIISILSFFLMISLACTLYLIFSTNRQYDNKKLEKVIHERDSVKAGYGDLEKQYELLLQEQKEGESPVQTVKDTTRTKK